MRFVRTAENIWGLPTGFQRAEYLQSTGTQYIDLGIGVKSNTVFKATFSIASTATGHSYFGARNSTNERFQIVNSIGIGGGYYLANNVYPVANKKYEIEMHANGDMYLDGVKRNASTGTFSQVAFERNLWLFATNYYDSSVGAGASTFWKVQIFEGDALVRDLIPCIDPLGVACMYDLVGKKPYYNQGTGEFTVGRQIIPVEYLESSGTQYIDTGVYGNLNTKIEAKVYSQRASSADAGYCIAGDFTTSTKAITMPFNFSNSGLYSRFGDKAITSGIQQDGTYTFAVDKGGYYVDGVKIANFNTTTSFTTGATIMLFGFTGLGRNYLVGKMYCCKIWDGDTLVRDFIPCKDENNVGFMFDTLSGTVYLNAGTGAFSVGENKYTSKLRLIKEAKELPDGYKRVEYLESDSTAYIDTGVSGANNNLKIEMGFSYSKFYAYGYFFSNYESEQHNTTRFLLDASNNSRGLAYINTKSQDGAIYNSNVTKDSFHTFVLTKTSLTIDGVTTTNNNPPVGTANTKNIILFNRGSGSYADKRDVGMRCYYFRIYDNDVLIRDLIPVLDNSGIPVMYDKVNGGTYYNQGTGGFTYGHTITPVEYLESTGTQYIDTGIKLDNNSSVELDYQLTQATQSRTGLFGALNMSGSNQGRFGSILSPSNAYLEHGYGASNDYWQQGLPDTSRHKIYQRKNEVYFDGTLIHTFSSATFSLAINAYLGNFVYTNYTPAKAKYYRSKWWDNGVLVRSFIPVRDGNNVGYMFDEVTGQLFGNAGSGSFGIGNDLRKPKVRFIQDVLPREYRPLKYLQSTDTQYIDTGVYPTQFTEVEYRCAVTGSVANVDSHLFGSRLSASSEAFDLAYMNTQPNGIEKFRFIHGTTTTQETTTSVTVSQLANPHTYYMSGTSFKVDGSEKMSFTTTSFIGSYSLWLFGVNSAGSLHNQVRAQRVYKCIIWDNGVPVRDFYPALRKSDNKPGMYDRITKQFFTNVATSGNDFNYEI